MKYLTFILILLGLSAYAQTDTTSLKFSEQESKTEQIDRLRKHLTEAVVEEDFSKMAKIRMELENKNTLNYIGLYPYEQMALDYLSFDFTQIPYMILYLDTAKPMNQAIIQPTYFKLGEILQQKLLENRIKTIQTIRNASLPEEEKKLLEIQHILMVSNADTNMTQDSLNTLSRDFVLTYPNSAYKSYVATYALYDYQPSKWGLGLDFFIGTNLFDGDLGNYFQTSFNFGIAFEIQYKKTTLYLRNNIGFSKTKTDISFQEDVWEKNNTVLTFLPEASLGYEVYHGKKIKVAPFGGISSMNLSPTLDKSEEEEYDKIELGFRSSPCIGLNLDIKLREMYGFVTTRKAEKSYGIIKIRYSYHKSHLGGRFSGGIHNFTIGYGGFGRTQNRIIYD